ncbi:hypothetical protein LOD99_2913 [Oopsacas minuta]|uniref:Ion transport domain-containing protein n=1 Tax=Oopsacas minuta TaxID=111878 RepID=A0AAV7JYS3_9METZ|nr:hypothetical protein LOD99_2913 [Oopsacas minuta]
MSSPDKDTIFSNDVLTPEKKIFIKPYLETFLNQKFAKKSIPWTGSKLDYRDYDHVLKDSNMDKLKRMILGGAPYLYKYDSNTFPMTVCAFYSRSDIIEIILERHKHEKTSEDEFEFESQASQALKQVCQSNSGEIAKMLLQGGTQVSHTSHPHQAAKNGSWVVLEEILLKLPDIDIDTADEFGNTPLHYATERGFTHTIKYLLDKNADPNKANAAGSTALHLACEHADEDAVYLLTLRGAEVNVRDKDGKTPTLLAGENGKHGVIHILAGAGADLDKRDLNGNVALIAAAKNGHSITLKELMLNGASLEVTDHERYNCLERAIQNRKDLCAAMYIRLEPNEDFLDCYLNSIEIHIFRLVNLRLTETLEALLDRMVIQNDKSHTNSGVVYTKYLDIDTENNIPEDKGYASNRTFFLQRLSEMGDEQMAYHGTIRLLVDKKMSKFGNILLGVRLFFYCVFLIALAYSLLQASDVQNPVLDTYLHEPVNTVRLVTDVFVLIFVLVNVFTESVEFFRILLLTFSYLSGKKKERRKLQLRDKTFENISEFVNEEDFYELSSMSEEEKRIRKLTSRLNDFFCIRVFTDYFTDKFNILDLLGLTALLILIVLRATGHPVQWVFATVAFLINTLRVFKFIVLIPHLGPYATTIYKILVRDVPLFSSLFCLTLLMFTGSYYISLRAPYTVEGFQNASLMQETQRTAGVDDTLYWVLLSGLRVLLEGNIYQDEYMYNQLNWLAAGIYAGFLFMTVVVLLNVFIAQLSDTYGDVKRNANRTYAWQRLNFIVQVQRTSLLSLCIDFRKIFYIGEVYIDKYDLFKYYAVHHIRDLNIKNFTDDIDVKTMLTMIQTQQTVARKTQEVARLVAPTQASQKISDSTKFEHGIASHDIGVLNARVSQILQLLREKDTRLEQKISRILDDKLAKLTKRI